MRVADREPCGQSARAGVLIIQTMIVVHSDQVMGEVKLDVGLISGRGMVGTALDWLSTVGGIREHWQDSDEQIIGDVLTNFELNLRL